MFFVWNFVNFIVVVVLLMFVAAVVFPKIQNICIVIK